MRKLSPCKIIFLACVFYGLAAISLPAQNLPFSTLVDFNGTNGQEPLGTLIQGSDGNLYGTTYAGGANGYGSIYKMTPTGTLTTIYSFCSETGCTDGANPAAALVLGSDGNFYGTTWAGGVFEPMPNPSAYGGTVFRITPAGVLTTLYNFCSESSTACYDGEEPSGTLIQGANGNLYGTTVYGGYGGVGTIFMVIPTGGIEVTLYSFCSQPGCTDGVSPGPGLTQDTNGNFYGTTQVGGANQDGTVFELTAEGGLITLYSFGGPDGVVPNSQLLPTGNGSFYGTTAGGGANGDGTLFEITTGGTLTTLHSFDGKDGQHPFGQLVQTSNGNLYGVTQNGGASFSSSSPSIANGYGSVFEMTPAGALTTVHSFDGTDGYGASGLVQADGTLYGTTSSGGPAGANNGDGTVFSLAESLPTICNGVFTAYFYTGNITVSNGDICQFSGGGVTGNVVMKGGTLVLQNASVGGNVQIQNGGTFTLGPSLTVKGNVQIQSLPDGTMANTICGAAVAGDLQIQSNATAVQIGSASGCAGNTINGNLQVQNNSVPTTIMNNTISGNLQDQSNSGSTAIVDNKVGGNLQVQSNSGSTQVSNNAVRSNLQCESNSSITGGGNTAAQKQGQCSAF
jgi:uncharacterized repeat protein (TIGR03803 family)